MARPIENRSKKYALLADELYQNLRSSNQRMEQLQSPEFSKVLNLDQKVQQILENKHLPDFMKARMYSELASEYLDAREKAPEINAVQGSLMAPVPPVIEQSKSLEDEEPKTEPIFQPAPLAIAAPIKKKSQLPISRAAEQRQKIVKAQERQAKENILSALKGKEHILDYDRETKQMKIHGFPFPQSDFFKILEYVSKSRPTGTAPKGAAQFLEVWKQSKMDPDLIRNKSLRQIKPFKITRGLGHVVKQKIKKWQTFNS